MTDINDAGIILIRTYEGCRLDPYQDIGGVWTIGYGHTKGITADTLPITQDQADAYLLSDIEPCEDAINNLFDGLNDNQFSALVSLCFNVGNAPLYHTLGDYLEQKLYEKAADEFLKWNHVNGKVVDGLTKRRTAERELFLTPIT